MRRPACWFGGCAEFLGNTKEPGTSFQSTVFVEFFHKIILFGICQTGPISLTDCVYFPSYSVKCISCFMLRHLMMWWNLKIRDTKILFSPEQKEFLK